MREEADGQKTRREPGHGRIPLQQPAVDPGGEEGAEGHRKKRVPDAAVIAEAEEDLPT